MDGDPVPQAGGRRALGGPPYSKVHLSLRILLGANQRHRDLRGEPTGPWSWSPNNVDRSLFNQIMCRTFVLLANSGRKLENEDISLVALNALKQKVQALHVVVLSRLGGPYRTVRHSM